MWPMRGPKASQKDPMAIREKHVPAGEEVSVRMVVHAACEFDVTHETCMHFAVGQPGTRNISPSHL